MAGRRLIYSVKELVGHSHGNVEHWHNLTLWRQGINYEREESTEYQDEDIISFDILLKKANIKVEKITVN